LSTAEVFRLEGFIGARNPDRPGESVSIVEIHDHEEVEPMPLARIDKSEVDKIPYFTGVSIPLAHFCPKNHDSV